ncbi:MAG: ABC transporter permease [Armatimonadota bacterium]
MKQSARSRLRRAPRRSSPLALLAVAAALVVVGPPLLWLAAAALRAPAEAGPPLLDPLARGLLTRSLTVAGLAALLALLLGAPLGWALARLRLPGRRLLTVGCLAPLLLPPYAAAHAWSQLLAREGPVNRALLGGGWIETPIAPDRHAWVAAAVLAFTYWPIAAWLVRFAARAVPRNLEDAARMELPTERALLLAGWPAVSRAVGTAALLLFLLSLADFGVTNSLGLPTYPVEIVRTFQSQPVGVVMRLALPLLVLVVPLVALQSRLLEGTPLAPAGESGEPLRASLLVRAGLAGWGAAAIGLSVLVPLGVLAAESLPLHTYVEVWGESADHFVNTLLSAGGGALLAGALAVGYVWAVRGRRVRGLDLLLTLPYALPGSLVGIALIQLLNRPGPAELLYSSLGGLVWLYAILFLPFPYKTVQLAWGHVDRELLEDALLQGASPWQQFRAAAWPALRPFATAGGVIAALLSAREIDGTALLRIPGGDTIAFRIYDYLHFAPGPKLGALCVLLVLLSGAVAGLALRWGGRASE